MILKPSKNEPWICDMSAKQLYFVRSSDSKLTPLLLQSFQDAASLPPTRLWLRQGTPPTSPATTVGRMSYWIAAPVLEQGTRSLRLGDYRAVGHAFLRLAASLPLSCFLFYGIELFSHAVQVAIATRSFGHISTNDGYRPVRDRASLTPAPVSGGSTASIRGAAYTDGEVASPTPHVGDDNEAHTEQFETPDQGIASRPRYLCYIRGPDQDTYETVNVSKFIKEEGHDIDLEYVFVSYTRHQFRVATNKEIAEFTGYPDEATREANRQLAERDRKTLTQWGITAAKRAGKRAFWIDFECVRDKDGDARSTSKSDDVYRICDVVRTAHSMIIALGPHVDEKVAAILAGQNYPLSTSQQEQTTQWLRHWGSRLWTLPELLLCPGEHRVKLYLLDQASDNPVALAKRDFVARAWSDANLVKELVYHFEPSATLAPTQFMHTALECLTGRGTSKFSDGDIAYALMGLFPIKQRPRVNPKDSGFQAFARLSLANDSGGFLSRLICMLPPGQQSNEGMNWYDSIRDNWGVKIWNVFPSSYAVELATDAPDTLVLDGAPSAAIRWDWFDKDVVKAGEWINAVMAFGFATPDAEFQPSPRVKLLQHIKSAIISALLVPVFYLWTQLFLRPRRIPADLVGIEGHVDAATIERHLWGFNHGRLSQTQLCSADYQDDEPNAGATLQGPKSQVEQPKFTLIDTHMMTVTHISTRKPPVAVFAVGSENGMQRVLLCSYDWRDDTFERETVLRVETPMLDQMKRIGKFRLRLQPLEDDYVPAARAAIKAEDKLTSDSIPTWKLEFLFLIIVFLGIQTLLQVYTCPGWEQPASYAVGIALVQIPAYLLISHCSITRLLPPLLMLKGQLDSINGLTLTDDSERSLGTAGYAIYSTVEGAVSGLIFTVLLVSLWSWWRLSPAQLTARTLLFAMCTGLLPAMVAPVAFERSDPDRMYILSQSTLGLFTMVVLLGWNRLGRPDEVRWLPALVKRRFGQPLRGTISASRRKQLAPFVLFVVAALVHLDTESPPTFVLFTEEFDDSVYLLWFIVALALVIVASTLLAKTNEKGLILLAILAIVPSYIASAAVERATLYRGLLLTLANLPFAVLPCE
ncbi:hypothetical protein NLG97_g4970 [Lecanicillium saksenae]|uniref:Uncharacterized protein n=1 Tax=Lecanicillium saksenae TaxID=468837 RepID=A0ACC1QTY9_9HYPO|nr:hypothetical protein NLG97_g4970 [Lecanicillium saksenae]